MLGDFVGVVGDGDEVVVVVQGFVYDVGVDIVGGIDECDFYDVFFWVGREDKQFCINVMQFRLGLFYFIFDDFG